MTVLQSPNSTVNKFPNEDIIDTFVKCDASVKAFQIYHLEPNFLKKKKDHQGVSAKNGND